jgi:hypothetical protein
VEGCPDFGGSLALVKGAGAAVIAGIVGEMLWELPGLADLDGPGIGGDISVCVLCHSFAPVQRYSMIIEYNDSEFMSTDFCDDIINCSNKCSNPFI